MSVFTIWVLFLGFSSVLFTTAQDAADLHKCYQCDGLKNPSDCRADIPEKYKLDCKDENYKKCYSGITIDEKTGNKYVKRGCALENVVDCVALQTEDPTLSNCELCPGDSCNGRELNVPIKCYECEGHKDLDCGADKPEKHGNYCTDEKHTKCFAGIANNKKVNKPYVMRGCAPKDALDCKPLATEELSLSDCNVCDGELCNGAEKKVPEDTTTTTSTTTTSTPTPTTPGTNTTTPKPSGSSQLQKMGILGLIFSLKFIWLYAKIF